MIARLASTPVPSRTGGLGESFSYIERAEPNGSMNIK